MSVSIHRLAAGVALTLALTVGGGGLASSNEKDIDAAIPLPEPANVPPPSAAEVGPQEAPRTAARPSAPAPVSVSANPAPEKAAAPAAAKDSKEPPTGTVANAPASTSTPGLTTDGAPAPQPSTAVPAPAPAAKPATPATPASVAPPAAKDVAAVDPAVVEKLREMVTTKLDRFLDRRTDRKAVESFYAARGFTPLWVGSEQLTAAGKGVVARLKDADAEGLDPADYPTPDVASLKNPEAVATAELRLTATALTYARNAQIGRIHFSRISGDINYDQKVPETAEVLAKLAQAKDAGEALGSYNPPQPGYKALKSKLAEVRNRKSADAPPRIETGTLLKVGMNDPRVTLVRARLKVPGDTNNTTYDKAVSEAVKKFQRQHDLQPTGNLNNATVAALNGPRREREADVIIANMERWRWMPRDLGKTYVMVNIPDFSLRVVRNGATVWQTRIVVGKPHLATPIMSAEMKYITVNPTWNVPPSIIANEYIPALRQDPTALDRIGLKVDYSADGTVRIYQPPGERNALGRIRFNFPNKFLVYQHDTPDKQLFAHEKRAYSHGCMRVQDPLKYAEVLLSLVLPQEGYTQERVRKMFGSEERDIQFPTFIPVHLTYQTAFVDDAGRLEIRDDVYGRDARVFAVLRGDERKVAEIAVERKPTGSNIPREALRIPDRAPSAYSGTNFFERLFRF